MQATQTLPAAKPLPVFSFFPLIAVSIWTGNVLATKAAATVIAPASIAFGRWLIAALVLTPFVLRPVWRQRAVVLAHWPKLALLGMLGMATYQGLAYLAARTTGAVNIGFMQSLTPLLSALLSYLLLREPLGPRTWLGGFVSLAGLLVLISKGHPFSSLAALGQPGDWLMLLAVAANSLYGVLLRRWALPLSTWQQLYVQIGFGLLTLLPFWLATPSAALTPAAIGLLLYAGLPASVGAPFCWMQGIKVLGPARASLFMNLLPLLVALAASVLLGEQMLAVQWLGGLVLLFGVWLGLSGKR